MTTTTFQGTWDSAVREHAGRPFLVFRAESGEVSEWSYGEFDAVVSRAAGVLSDAGADRGSAVHVVLRNCPAFVALWLAAARLGAWLVPVDPASTTSRRACRMRRQYDTLPSSSVSALR